MKKQGAVFDNITYIVYKICYILFISIYFFNWLYLYLRRDFSHYSIIWNCYFLSSTCDMVSEHWLVIWFKNSLYFRSHFLRSSLLLLNHGGKRRFCNCWCITQSVPSSPFVQFFYVLVIQPLLGASNYGSWRKAILIVVRKE